MSVVSRWFLIGGVSVVIRSCLGDVSVVFSRCFGGFSVVSRWFLGVSVFFWWFLDGFLVVSSFFLVVSVWSMSGDSFVFRWCLGGVFGVAVVSWW